MKLRRSTLRRGSSHISSPENERPTRKPRNVQDILSQPLCRKVYREYLSRAMALSPLLFIEAVEDFKSKPHLQVATAHIVFQKFLEDDAICDIQPDEELRENLRVALFADPGGTDPDALITPEFFDPALPAAYLALESSVSDFFQSDLYKKFCQIIYS